MKKVIITLTVLMLMVPLVSAVENVLVSKQTDSTKTSAVEKKKTPVLTDILPQIDKIERRNIDIDTMYWAWRITDLKDINYKQLKTDSKDWIMTPETKKLFFSKLKKILDAKTSRRLTNAEMEQYDNSLEQIKNLLSPARKDTELIDRLSVDYCVELESRYWAGLIQAGQKSILEDMKNQPNKSAIRKEIEVKIIEKLEKDNAPLTEEESYKLDACIEKLSGM
ncbi:MAG: hypothetical protein WCS77_04560 [Elusimicrobiaceae bacterium]